MDALKIAAEIDIAAAAGRLSEVVHKTPLVPVDVPDERVTCKLKLECLQETGSFKARGAWNQISQLTPAERRAGVCATSSGNHGRAVAWAARRAGVPATLFMPANVYKTKLEACRAEGAEVFLFPTRAEAEAACAERVAAGLVLIHPYDAQRTIEGAGTVGREIAQDDPDVELVVFPVGGGGLIAGSSLAIARELGDEVAVLGVEPAGSPNLTAALEVGRPVRIEPIETEVQGLCPIDTGAINLALCARYVEGMITLTDEEIFAAQRELVVNQGLIVEAAGAAAFAAVWHQALPPELVGGRSRGHPLRTVCVVSGGNADPEQLEALK